MIRLEDLYSVSNWPLYTTDGKLINTDFLMANKNMLVENIEIYTKFEIDKTFGIKGLKVSLLGDLYEDTDSVVTP